MPMAEPMAIKAMPKVPIVPQDPKAMAKRVENKKAKGKKKAGERMLMP